MFPHCSHEYGLEHLRQSVRHKVSNLFVDLKSIEISSDTRTMGTCMPWLRNQFLFLIISPSSEQPTGEHVQPIASFLAVWVTNPAAGRRTCEHLSHLHARLICVVHHHRQSTATATLACRAP